MARKKIIAGNWKMNMTPSQAVELINTLKPLVATEDADVVFCVPAIDIIPAIEAAKGSNIEIGAENMYYEEKGAYTGEIAPDMLLMLVLNTLSLDILKEESILQKQMRPLIRRFSKLLSMALLLLSAAASPLLRESRELLSTGFVSRLRLHSWA